MAIASSSSVVRDPGDIGDLSPIYALTIVGSLVPSIFIYLITVSMHFEHATYSRLDLGPSINHHDDVYLVRNIGFRSRTVIIFHLR